MTCEEIFKDYLVAGYNPTPWKINTTDFKLSEFIILRLNGKGLTIHYLNSGASLNISKNWMALWMDFYSHSGNQVLNNLFTEPVSVGDSYLNRFIYYMTLLVSPQKELCLRAAGELSRLGTKDFIDYIKQEWPLINIHLTPWLFSTCMDDVEI